MTIVLGRLPVSKRMSDQLNIEKLDDRSALLLMAREQFHTAQAIERLAEEMKKHRETVDARVTALDDKIEKKTTGLDDKLAAIDKRLHTIETTAKTGSSMADWGWRVGPALVAAIFWLSSLVHDIKEPAKILDPPAAISTR